MNPHPSPPPLTGRLDGSIPVEGARVRRTFRSLILGRAAILAVAPLALALGGGASMERPLAIAIISGLIVQGPLVLLAMPALYKLLGGTRPRPAPAAPGEGAPAIA